MKKLTYQECLDVTFSKDSDKLPSAIQLPMTDDLFNIENYKFRSEYVKHSFTILTEEMILGIKRFLDTNNITKIAELMAGSGWISHWLTKYDVEVLHCSDNHSWSDRLVYHDNVEKRDAIDYIKTDGQEIELIIVSWAYMDPTLADVWKGMKEGQYLIYIGEGRGGCTANDEFFDLVECKDICELDNSRFQSIHDYITVYLK